MNADPALAAHAQSVARRISMPRHGFSSRRWIGIAVATAISKPCILTILKVALPSAGTVNQDTRGTLHLGFAKRLAKVGRAFLNFLISLPDSGVATRNKVGEKNDYHQSEARAGAGRPSYVTL
jgi:hypothetical protein